LANNLISALKLIFAILLLPIVIFSSISFFVNLRQMDLDIFNYFIWGILSYLILHLFIYEPAALYRKSQEIVPAMFRFFAPLVKVASFCLPIYTIFLLAILGLVSSAFKDVNITKELVFLVSFSFIFHLVFTAGALKTNTNDILKANYFFSMQLIYLINLFIIAFCFSYFLEKFSFIDFYNNTFSKISEIYKSVFSQLFITKT